jgi:hypothetical protein
MSELIVGVAHVLVDAETGGWLFEICRNGAEATMERAKRDGVIFPTDAIAETLEDLSKASRIRARTIDTASPTDAPTSDAIGSANEAGQTHAPSPLWGTCEVAQHTGLTESRVRQLAAAGELPATRINSTWVFRSEEVTKCRP